MRDRTGGLLVSALALLVGLGIGYVDSRPTWDDTGITVGALVLSAGLLGFLRPRLWWLTGIFVAVPVPLFNLLRGGSPQSGVALAFSLAAAGIGSLVAKALAHRLTN